VSRPGWLVRNTTPAARVLCAVIVVAALATAPVGSVRTSVAAVAVTLLALTAARPGWKGTWQKLWPGVLLITALVVPLLAVGRHADAATLGMRALLALIAAVSFAQTLHPDELAGALYALRVPPALANVVATLLRQLEMIRAEARAIGLARRLRGTRGFALGGDALALLLIRVAARAERVELAQRLRGFGVRAAAARAQLRARDAVVLALAVVLGLSLHLIDRAA
jgi:energy-coupling factor transporter transmembrane protein EcfT